MAVTATNAAAVARALKARGINTVPTRDREGLVVRDGRRGTGQVRVACTLDVRHMAWDLLMLAHDALAEDYEVAVGDDDLREGHVAFLVLGRRAA